MEWMCFSIDDFFVNSIFIYPMQKGLINPMAHHPGFTIFERVITLQRGLVVDSLTQCMLGFFLLLV